METINNFFLKTTKSTTNTIKISIKVNFIWGLLYIWTQQVIKDTDIIHINSLPH